MMNDEERKKALEREISPWFTVQESCAKALMRFGAFNRFVMAYKDHKFDEEWNVIPSPGKGEGQGVLGGLHFKIPVIEKDFVYRFRWKDIQFVEDGKDIVRVHEKIIDYIFLKPTYYAFDVEKAETGKGERIPLTLHLSALLQVVNPYKTLFKGVPNWFENASARLASMIRDWVAQKTLDEVLSFRRDPEGTWNEIKNNPIIKALEEDWGIKVIKNGIDIRSIDLPKEYEEAAALEKKKELEAKAKTIEIIGTIIEMLAKSRGKTIEEIQKEIDESNELKKEFLEIARDLLIRKMGIEGKSYVDIRVEGAEGFEKMILDALATWRRIPPGERSKDTEDKKEKEEEELTQYRKLGGGFLTKKEAKRIGLP